MRRSIVVAVLLSSIVGCNAERLTGARAQRAVAEAKVRSFDFLPDSIVIFVNDVRQTAASLDSLRPETVERIEVVKGEAAVVQFGVEARSGAILIYTKKSR